MINKFYKNFLLIILLNCLGIYNCISQTDIQEKNILKHKEILKEVAFCKCIKHYFKEDSLILADGSIGKLLSGTPYELEAYFMLDSIIKKLDSIDYNYTQNITCNIKKCIDFYRSKFLNELINSMDNYLNYDLIKFYNYDSSEIKYIYNIIDELFYKN